ncbi:hypothetical protein APR41_14990 [Salegentibacter salinarum]|uniref:Tyr recombinase domain-containing protein n=1 Tax=Salegentibacter salinarum TaxID=447422 RepID=A0A2N0TZ12_9FLAO|nr:site-specific integrase [Salegentibacter salinarum]PKD19984.1 hypothetical protein APR41_14990 [Salegentibacter salinarum]SKB96950.1 Phage integrase family protein [Salegentibacter salinarum]
MPIDRLDHVRDMFVFSSYTEISYTDLIKLTKNNNVLGTDGDQWIIYNRQKTHTAVEVPLLDTALQILEKYQAHPITKVTETLLPCLTNKKLNVFLKEVGLVGGIKKLTFHMGRHTLATTVTRNNGLLIETVVLTRN